MVSIRSSYDWEERVANGRSGRNGEVSIAAGGEERVPVVRKREFQVSTSN